ncbi:MAG: hypothetical protein J3Q66DRAFT_431068 [Benniella sp.]|nr:MAG: hypothetical protein J3Q66DRAFT_431068 [Benniella sp.]
MLLDMTDMTGHGKAASRGSSFNGAHGSHCLHSRFRDKAAATNFRGCLKHHRKSSSVSNNGSKEEGFKSGACFYCHKQGHQARMCLVKTRQSSSSSMSSARVSHGNRRNPHTRPSIAVIQRWNSASPERRPREGPSLEGPMSRWHDDEESYEESYEGASSSSGYESDAERSSATSAENSPVILSATNLEGSPIIWFSDDSSDKENQALEIHSRPEVHYHPNGNIMIPCTWIKVQYDEEITPSSRKPSNLAGINQQIPPPPPPSSQIPSLSSTGADLDEIDWPQFGLEEDIPFEDFIQNFGEIFQTEKIDPSKKVTDTLSALVTHDVNLLPNARNAMASSSMQQDFEWCQPPFFHGNLTVFWKAGSRKSNIHDMLGAASATTGFRMVPATLLAWESDGLLESWLKEIGYPRHARSCIVNKFVVDQRVESEPILSAISKLYEIVENQKSMDRARYRLKWLHQKTRRIWKKRLHEVMDNNRAVAKDVEALKK